MRKLISVLSILAIFSCFSYAYGCEESELDLFDSKCAETQEKSCCAGVTTEKLSNLKEQQWSNSFNIKHAKSELDSLKLDVKTLTSKVNKLDSINNSLRTELKSKQSDPYGAWTSLLLACVAIIVTVLGVSVAVLAFWGFTNIKKASVSAAVVESIEKSEKEIEKAINSGQFNSVIERAIDRAVYRGILSESDFPNEEGGENEMV